MFRGGLVVYATDLKTAVAGVPMPLLAEHGPVHPEVAVALAAGARTVCGADWGLATTGVAGPDDQNEIPVGTVFVAVSSAVPGARDAVRRLALDGSREAIRGGTVVAALELVATALRELP